MNLFAEMRVLVIAALDKMINAEELPVGIEFDNVAVEPPRDPLHGDMATNAAMVLAKPAGKKPREMPTNWPYYCCRTREFLRLMWRVRGFLICG